MVKSTEIPLNATKKLGISNEKARLLALREKKSMDEFYKKYLLNFGCNNEMILILKTHLYVENILDEILSSLIPNPKKIIKESRFIQKINILEALNVSPGNLLIEKMKLLNNIRNDFSHDLQKRISNDELNNLLKGLQAQHKPSRLAKIKYFLFYIVGYLHALKALNNLFPFAMFCISHEGCFKKDKGYSRESIKKIYPWEEMIRIIENLKLP